MATLTLNVRKARSNVFYKTARIPEGTKVAKFYTKKTGSWVSKDNIVYIGEDRFIFNIDDAEIDAVGDADYYVTLSVDGGPEQTVVQGYIDHEEPVRVSESPEVAPVAGILLLDAGATVPSDTPVNTVVFEKPVEVTYDFRTGALPAGWSKIGSTSGDTYSGAGLNVILGAGQGFLGPAMPAKDMIFEVLFPVYGDKVMTGPGFLDASGNGVNTGMYNSPSGQLIVNVGAYNYTSGFISVGGLATTVPNMRLRLTKTGGAYTAQLSFDNGVTWVGDLTPFTNVTTVTRLAIFNSLGSNPQQFTIAEALVRSTSTGPKGYWDGTKIKSL